MILNQERTFKKACFYQRVNTNSQDVEMQVQAAARFRERYSEEDIIEINEHGVSSNKLSMKNRKHLQAFVEMIKRDEIHTLYVYDRSRLTRRFYEYFFLYSLLWEHNVEVVFTTTDASYPPFSQDTVTEGINALLTEEEGKNISRRSLDTHKKTPNQKFGYILEKHEHGRQYVQNPCFQGAINRFFDNIRTIDSIEELFKAAVNLKKAADRPLKMIFAMVTDPFYCGHEKSNNNLYPLPYVSPYLSVEEFNANFNKFEPLLKKLALQETELELQNIFSVKCGNCSRHLRYAFDAVLNEAYYYCNCDSKKNKRVRYDILEIRKVVTTAVHNYFQHVDLNYIQSLSIQALRQIENKLCHQRKKLIGDLKEKELSLALSDLHRMHPDCIQTETTSIKQLKTNCVNIETDMNLCSFARHRIQEHVRIIQEQLLDELLEDDLIKLAPSIIDELIAHHDKIEVIQFFNDGCQQRETYQIIEVYE